MAALTPNYEFNLPEEGADTDLWGGLLNENWAGIDTLLKTMRDELEQQITDAIEAARIKVGDLYFSADADDPATKLGYGTWVAHGEGRAIVGVGDNGTSTWAIDEERGAETHTMIIDEMPAHAHGPGNLQGTSAGAGAHGHNGSVFGFSDLVGGSALNVDTRAGTAHRAGGQLQSVGDHAHFVQMTAGATTGAGGQLPHNNVQPSIGVYVWKRTE